MPKTPEPFFNNFIRWLLILLFGLIGASFLTYGFMSLVSTNPELNAFSMMFLKRVTIDIHVFVFLFNLGVCVLIVALIAPSSYNNDRPTKVELASDDVHLDARKSQKIRKNMDVELKVREKLREKNSKEKFDLEIEKLPENDKVLPRPD